ncbi:AAA family ATPase, partial [Arsenophonus sp. ENCA]
MSLQYERIEKFCEQLKLERLSTEWPAVAQATVDKNGTHADFLESVLRLQYEGLTERRRQTIL